MDSDPEFGACEKRFIEMMWENGATAPEAYLISLADGAAEWELQVEEAVDERKENET